MECAVIVGGPGAGKTTRLLSIMDKVLLTDIKDPLEIGFISFTRAARREASTRAAAHFKLKPEALEQQGWFRTVHSLCHKAIGVGANQLLAGDARSRAWLKNVLQADIEVPDIEEQSSFEDYRTPEARALSLWDLSRNRLEAFAKTHEWVRRGDDSVPALEECWKVIRRYEEAKAREGMLDFTDLLARAARAHFDGGEPTTLDYGVKLPVLPAVIIDEAQDNSALVDLVCQWLTNNSRWVYLAGDPCQPPESLVTVVTKKGNRWGSSETSKKRIDCLKVGDVIAGYCPKDGKTYFNRTVEGVTRRDFSGELIEIKTADGKTSRYTPNHHCYASFGSLKNYHCVYLMRRGRQFRIGSCQVNYSSGPNGLTHRLRAEGGDAIWLVELHRHKKEARLREMEISHSYNIPQVVFKNGNEGYIIDDEGLERFWKYVGENEDAGLLLMDDFKLEEKHPVAVPGRQWQQSFKRPAIFKACNLRSGMAVRTEDGRWAEIEVRRVKYSGYVYSLTVSHDRLYIADGIVTHNCQAIFSFAGASPQAMMWHHAKKDVLPLSHRCPRQFLEPARAIARRTEHWEEHEFRPNGQDGVVREIHRVPSLPEAIEPTRDTLVLARSNYLAQRLAAQLTEKGIPWRPTRGRGGFDAPRKVALVRAVAALRRGEAIGGEDWASLARALPCVEKGTRYLEHGLKEKLKDPDYCEAIEPVRLAEIERHGGTPELRTSLTNGDWADLVKGTAVIQAAMKTHGEALVAEPKIRVGTVHCSPPDEPVLTTTGWVPIGNLKIGSDRLASYNVKNNRLLWNGNRYLGYDFDIKSRPYSGVMLTVKTAVSKTRITPDHRLQVRFSDSFMNKYVVYLMRRGRWWRVGHCTSARRPYVSGGIGGRLATEQADCGWIIGVYETKREAAAAELAIQGRYGITGLSFESCEGRRLTSGELHEIHEEISKGGDAARRVSFLLDELGISKTCPLYVRSSPGGEIAKKNMRSAFLTEARNLIPGYMEVQVATPEFAKKIPTGSDKPPVWLEFTVSKKHYDGVVFSLDVLPWRHYVSGNLVVHNSAKGAEADDVVLWDAITERTAEATKNDRARLDEERRVWYVGMTRAKKKITVVRANRLDGVSKNFNLGKL